MIRKKKTDIDLIVWDLDGTLLDTALYIVENWVHMFEKYHVPQPHLNDMIYFSGPPLVELLPKYFPDVPLEELLREYDDFSIKKSNYYSNIYPDEMRTLSEMKEAGYQMAILTSKRREACFDNLRYWKLDQFMDYVVTVQDAPHPKPNPEGMRMILNHFQASPERVFTIGDSPTDIEVGKKTGIHTGFASWGIKKHPPVDSEETYQNFLDIERSFITHD